MLSLVFYLIIGVIILATAFLLIRGKKQGSKILGNQKENISPEMWRLDTNEEESSAEESSSPFDSNLVVLRINSFLGKPYMGYELHQALLDAEMRFGEMDLFHRYATQDRGKILFSIAAATPTGQFSLENMGSFKCNALFLFMCLDTKSKLMDRFDLMLDTARQLAEELGGDIVDDLLRPINAGVIKKIRERICDIDTSNHYAMDFLDNLD